MASRSKYVFVTMPELVRWLNEAAKAIAGSVVLYRGSQSPLERWDGREDTMKSARRAYVVTGEPDLNGAPSDSIVPGRLGWLQLDVPRSEGSALFAIQIAARSDWLDEATNTIKDNPGVLKLFDRFWTRWKRHFASPVLVRNRMTGEEAPYPSIAYSEGAAAWFRQGGELRQQGVANIEFKIPT